MKDYRELKVWQRSHGLTLGIYRASKTFPKDELFGLTSQMRRASASIPANIAEGCGRGTDREFAQFLQIAMGSASEVDYPLLLAKGLEYLSEANHARLFEQACECTQMLNALLKTVRNS